MNGVMIEHEKLCMVSGNFKVIKEFNQKENVCLDYNLFIMFEQQENDLDFDCLEMDLIDFCTLCVVKFY